MIKGIGIDIIEIDRVRHVLDRFGTRFLNRILTPAEQVYCLAKKDPAPSIAVRFSAKEAVAKALGTGLGKKLSFLEIVVTTGPSGRPEVALSGLAADHFHHPSFLLSLSHSHCYATATVLWQES